MALDSRGLDHFIPSAQGHARYTPLPNQSTIISKSWLAGIWHMSDHTSEHMALQQTHVVSDDFHAPKLEVGI